MIDSLAIKNFKNFQDFQIEGLGRVNLFTGKNNTGKSTLLEALAIYFSGGDIKTLAEILLARGEINDWQDRINSKKNSSVLRAASSLMYNRKISTKSNDTIFISPFDSDIALDTAIKIGFVQTYDEKNGDGFISKILKDDSKLEEPFFVQHLLQIDYKGKKEYLPLEDGRFDLYVSKNTLKKVDIVQNIQFIRSITTNQRNDEVLWSKIALTEKEDYVIRALQIVEPTIERITFVSDFSKERTTVAKLSNSKEVVPLQSMGDGINRILSITLAAVNAAGGVLLIDEFENGLHYTVQENLWKIIFELSKELDIQVFATTHSNDCIKGFEEVLNASESSGKLFRLEKKDDKIIPVSYSEKELAIATDRDIETR